MSDPDTHVTFQAPDIAEIAPLFPGYEIEILIATGGMGAVYRAVQKSLDRTVAIKILPHEFSNDAAFCAGFEAEAKAMARLNHPNLIGVYDFGEINGMLYIVMEYVPGQSLYHSSNGMAIDPGEVIRLVTGICNGLAHAHEHGILHRDIKPSNILLDLNALPKIGDFGLARPVETKVQEGEEIFGTPHYTAPEVVSAPHSVDHRADIFSVGVLLHELLTGRLPADDPRSASAIAHCDPRFDAIIRRATNPAPEGRYHSAAEIADALHVIASTAGPRILKTAAHAPPGGIRRRPVKKSGGNPALVFLLVAAIAAGVGYVIYSQKSQPSGQTIPKATIPGIPQIHERHQATKGGTPKPPQPRETTPVVPQPTPEEKNLPEETPTSEPSPVPEDGPAQVLPKFNVPAFFELARNIMFKRAAPLIAARDNDLKENIVRFERDARRLVRKVSSNTERKTAEEKLDSLIKESADDHNQIQTDLDWRLGDIQAIKDLHGDYLDKQAAIDLQLKQSLAQLSSTYTLGLQKQIERLQTEDDPAAIQIIEEEIAKTREDAEYFPDLMLSHEK